MNERSRQLRQVPGISPDGPTVAEVAVAIETASIGDLADVMAGWHPVFGLNREPRFVCIRCAAPDAFVVGPARWRCSSCRFTGTIFALRRAVAEDADACDRLLRLLATPVEYVPDPEPVDPWEQTGTAS